jgi:hypothetical protein
VFSIGPRIAHAGADPLDDKRALELGHCTDDLGPTKPAENIVSDRLGLSTSPSPKTSQMAVSRGTPGNAGAVQPAQNQIHTPSAATLSPTKEELATGVTAIEKESRSEPAGDGGRSECLKRLI